MSRLAAAYSLIDAANSADPHLVAADGIDQPAERLYGERMTAMLARIYPNASEALAVAARAQHLRRFEIPRSSYPMTRPGYLAWRTHLKAKHAEWAGELLAIAGYSADEIARIGALIRKENLKQDADAQALEDTAALVFLEFYALDFAAKHEPAKVRTILAKTFAKMSPRGRMAAQDLTLPEPVRRLVETLAPVGSRVSRERRGTAGVAAILTSHGDRAGDAPNANLIIQAAAIREQTGLPLVLAGVLKGEPSLEDALDQAIAHGIEEILVYPLFMADGYFVRKVLPERIAAKGLDGKARILTPLGLDPRLPPLVAEIATGAAAVAEFNPPASRLLIVGHGSKIGPASADATRALASSMQGLHAFATVAVAFLEESPFLDAALKDTELPTVVTGFFFGDGLHAGEDVPQAISNAGANAVYTGAIGASPAIPALIAEALTRARSGAA